MQINKHEAMNRSWLNRLLTVLRNRITERVVLGMSVAGAVLGWQMTNRHFESRNQDLLQFEITEVHGRIVKRMAEYEQVLRGGIALYRASDHVSRDDWQRYVETSEVVQRYPGIQAMAVSRVITASDLLQHTADVQAEGFPEYSVWPIGEREPYTAIVFIEPFDWRNNRAFGYDMYSESVRRLAMDRAADTGLPSISGRITLVQETSDDVQAGVLCYLPIYTNGAVVDSVEARRRELQGWVYAAFRFDNLMAGIVGTELPGLTFKIYDSGSTSPASLLYDSDGRSDGRTDRHFPTNLKAQLAGRDWTIQFAAQSGSLTATQASLSRLVAAAGLLFNILLYAVMRSLRKQRESAMELARQSAVGFEHSESRTELILQNASEAILSVSTNGVILSANRSAHLVFAAKNKLAGQELAVLMPVLNLEDGVRSTATHSPAENGIDIRCFHEDGSAFPGRASIGFLNADQRSSYIVIVRDETARVEAEKLRIETSRQLVAASHKAGKAEVATGVLHNVGNVINSINVSATLLREQVNGSPVDQLCQTSAVIEENEADLVAFFQHDKRASHLPAFLRQLSVSFQTTRTRQLTEVDSLMRNVEHIKEVISMQQNSAKKHSHAELVEPSELFEDAVKMNETNLSRCGINIFREFQVMSAIHLRKHDVLQILVNLLKNAQQAIEMSQSTRRCIHLKLASVNDMLVFSVTDSGVGIPPQSLVKIFKHGFTTKESGHGFGLHSSWNTAREAGGSLSVSSEGDGLGATFALRIPLQPHLLGSLSDVPTPPP